MRQLIFSDDANTTEYVSILLDIMQSPQAANTSVRIDIMSCFIKMFSLSPELRNTFRECSGFPSVMSLFITMQVKDSTDSVSEGTSIDCHFIIDKRICRSRGWRDQD